MLMTNTNTAEVKNHIDTCSSRILKIKYPKTSRMPRPNITMVTQLQPSLTFCKKVKENELRLDIFTL